MTFYSRFADRGDSDFEPSPFQKLQLTEFDSSFIQLIDRMEKLIPTNDILDRASARGWPLILTFFDYCNCLFYFQIENILL
jgi:hypothetical protein